MSLKVILRNYFQFFSKVKYKFLFPQLCIARDLLNFIFNTSKDLFDDMKDQKGLLEHHFAHLKGLGDDIEAGIKNQILSLLPKFLQFWFCNHL